MVNWKRYAAGTVVLAAVLVIVTGGSAGADPLPPGPISTAYDLFNYKIAVTSEQLYDAMPASAKAAWGAQEARYAAESAGAYRASLMYNNVGSETLAGVTPIKGFRDRLTPMTSLGKFTKITPGSVGGLAVAAMAYSQRADLSNQVTAWFGGDATSVVCSDPVFGGHNPLNTLTGQNCDQWKMAQEYATKVNAGETAGVTFGATVCNVGAPSHCIRPEGPASIGGFYCFATTGTVSGESILVFYGTAYVTNGATTNEGIHERYCGSGVHGDLVGTGDHQITAYCLTDVSVMCDIHAPIESGTMTGDPDRWLTCTYTFTDGTTASGDSGHFHESQLAGGSWPQPSCPIVPDGKTLAHLSIAEMGGANDPTVLEQQDTLSTYQSAQGSASPSCDAHACILDLVDLRSGHSCFSEAGTCDGWLQSSTRDADYKCQYGGADRPVQSCYVYANTFSAAKRQAGDAYADPHTGNDPGSGTSINADELNMGRALQSPAVTRDCFGGTYSSFNPLEWVVKPIQCGLEWAFTPRQAVVQAVGESLQHKWDTKAPGQLAAMIGGWSFAPSASGCSIVVPYSPMPGMPAANVTVLDACSGPMVTAATLCRLLVSAGLTVGVFLAVKRAIGGMVDYK